MSTDANNNITTEINGFTVGIKQGSPLRDAQNIADDGYDYLREHTKRGGSPLRDAADVNPTQEG